MGAGPPPVGALDLVSRSSSRAAENQDSRCGRWAILVQVVVHIETVRTTAELGVVAIAEHVATADSESAAVGNSIAAVYLESAC